MLADVDYESLTPHSLALSQHGEIAVGLPFFVHLLTPANPGWLHQWLVPSTCTRFEYRRFLCVCTGRD